MKFNDLYPQHKKTPTLMGPNADVFVTDNLSQTWRLYPCFICGEVTGWRLFLDNSPSSICSEECMVTAITQNEEIKSERFKDVTDIVEACTEWYVA